MKDYGERDPVTAAEAGLIGILSKGGTRQSKRSPYKVRGFHLHDKVLIYETGQIGYITGLRSSGKFQISNLQNKPIGDRSCSKLKLLDHSGGIILIPSVSLY